MSASVKTVMRRIALWVFGFWLLLLIMAFSSYIDMWGFSSDMQAGRTKNGIAVMVSGIVASELHPGETTTFEFDVEKFMYPDAEITGHTTPLNIESYMPLAFSSSTFSVASDSNGTFEGNVKKSEFDWSVTGTASTWEVNRWGPKFDSALVLTCHNGTITGTYVRPAFWQIDWDITGSYTDDGHVTIDVRAPFMFGFTLTGRVVPASAQ